MRRAILPAAILAMIAGAPAQAEPIIVVPPADAAAAPALDSQCVTAQAGGGVTEVECIVSPQTSPTRGIASTPPARILIRAEIAPQRTCVAGNRHVVDLRTPPPARGLPQVVQEALQASCAS